MTKPDPNSRCTGCGQLHAEHHMVQGLFFCADRTFSQEGPRAAAGEPVAWQTAMQGLMTEWRRQAAAFEKDAKNRTNNEAGQAGKKLDEAYAALLDRVASDLKLTISCVVASAPPVAGWAAPGREEAMSAALEPFAWIGSWLFARDLPDDTPMVTVKGVGRDIHLTRGMFKAAHLAVQGLLDTAAEDHGDQGNHDCLAKRRPGEPMFIFLGRDPDAHNLVRLWAKRRLAAGGDPEHCQMGLDTAGRMKAYAADPVNRPASAPPAEAYPPTHDPAAVERLVVATRRLVDNIDQDRTGAWLVRGEDPELYATDALAALAPFGDVPGEAQQ